MVKRFFGTFDDPELFEQAYAITLYHHEKWNGKGYPFGLSKEEIPLAARIMAIADVYDALVSDRVYKKAMPAEEAFEILLNEAGQHFDPDLIRVLFAIKDEFIEIANSKI